MSCEVVGHRGAAADAPENTLASFEEAIAQGAERVEFDVRRSSDGHAVVFHDATTDRFAGGGKGRAVGSLALVELRSLDVGAVLGRPGCFVPSLREMLDALKGRVRFNLEVKGAGRDGLANLALALDALRRHGVEGETIVSSFHASVVRRAAQEAPSIERALIVDARAFGDPVAAALACDAAGLHPHDALVDRSFVERCRRAGLRVRPWTVNDSAEIRRLLLLGVDAIVSDRPRAVRETRDTMPAS